MRIWRKRLVETILELHLEDSNYVNFTARNKLIYWIRKIKDSSEGETILELKDQVEQLKKKVDLMGKNIFKLTSTLREEINSARKEAIAH